jgi:cysteine desulfurase
MIYLDNNATTKINQRVYHKQCEILNKFYGNPSSLYPFGKVVKEYISTAREQIALFINADLSNGNQLLFTSCATESNNTVFHSVLQPNAGNKHIIISSVEHPSVLSPSAYYESIGCKVTRVSVNSEGLVDEQQLLSAITKETTLVSVMLVNSETGVIQDINRISKSVKAVNKDILIHTDAVQAAGKIPIDVQSLGVDFLTLSGHKFHAPKGVGVLYIKSGVSFTPFMMGGHQEFNMRAGTENTASIAAMGEAAVIAMDNFKSGAVQSMTALRNSMEQQLLETFPNCIIFGKNAPRTGNTTNIGFEGVIGDKLVLQLAQREICVSSGTACNSVSAEPSGVLTAMGAPEKYIRSIRISLSTETAEADIQALVSALKEIIN